jgi:mannosyl-3-phosphoglycerate phosphatase
MLSNPLVFTDLDGTLLDHHTYSFAAAKPMLTKLKNQRIPIIPNTSKTYAELTAIRQELGLNDPFIVENGAAVYLPIGYFPQQPSGTQIKNGFWVKEFSADRQRWIHILESLKPSFAGQFDHFSNMSTQQIIDCTGLSQQQAKLAATREFGEPVLWLGDEQRKIAFIQQLQKLGATPLQGGRFLHVSGKCDKGLALSWLRQEYISQQQLLECHAVALGDGQNDIAMLEAADIAVRILSPVNEPPKLARQHKVHTSKEYGPEGWYSSLEHIIFNHI